MSVRTYELTTSSALRAAPLRLEGAPAPGRAATPDVNRYDHAVTLVDQTRSSIRKVTDRKGPRAKVNAVDAYLAGHEWARMTGGFGFGVVAFGAAIASVPLFADTGTGPGLYATAVTVISAALSALSFSGEARVDRREARHGREKLDSGDVERMLAPYMSASAEDRAVLEQFVRKEIAYLDESLSPKAALTRDQLLAGEGEPGCGIPELERARRLAYSIRKLRDATGEYHYRGDEAPTIAAIEAVIDEAPEQERKQIATTLERVLFAGEHPTFKATVETQRRLYAAILKAARGEPVTEQPAVADSE